MTSRPIYAGLEAFLHAIHVERRQRPQISLHGPLKDQLMLQLLCIGVTEIALFAGRAGQFLVMRGMGESRRRGSRQARKQAVGES